MSIKCVIIDLDDTLIKTTQAIQITKSKLLLKLSKKYNIPIKKMVRINNLIVNEIAINKTIKAHEVGKIIWKKMFETLNIPHTERLVNLQYEKFHKELCRNLHTHDDVKEFCEYLMLNNIKLIIFSNGLHKERIERIKKVKLDKYIYKVYSSESLGVDKPNKNAIMRILKENNFKTNETIMIGDSFKDDIEPILNTKIIAIHFNNNAKNSKKYFAFDTFLKIKEFIERISYATN